MKTILVVYTNLKLTNKEIADNKLIKYAFRTSEDVEVGDLIESKDYSKSMQVVDVIDTDYKFYNAQTGELRKEINSTKMYPIKTIVFKEEDELTVFAAKKMIISIS